MIGSCGQPVSQGGQDKHMSPRVQLMRAANPAGHEQQCHHPKQPMGAGEQRLGNQSNAIMSANQASRRSGKRWPAIVSVSLPLLFMFLLPSLKRSSDTIFESSNRDAKIGCSHLAENLYRALSSPDGLFPADDLSLVGMLLSLIKLPLDRWRLEQIGLSAEAREISSKQDLQEEEQQTTHLSMMLAPAEPQLNYAQPVTASVYHQGANGPVSYQRHFGQAPVAYQRHIGQTPGPALEVASQAEQPTSGGDYATSGVSGDVEPVLAPVEGQALATQGDSAAASAQSTTSLAGRNDLPAVRALNVKCEKNHMTVNIVFDKPFYGLVFSKGHYNDQKCVHLPANSGQTTVNFDIHLGKCGMTSSDSSGNPYVAGSPSSAMQGQSSSASQQQPNGLYIENTIIIQYDPQVQEIFDQARKLRCTWYDYYEKSVTFRPYNVDMLDAVTANFLGDNIQCWMQIQVGKGPWSSEVAGIVKIGQTMTMVLAIKDDENRFDMLVRNCVAHDGKHQPIQLVDEYGCVARPKIMSRFQKVRNFGPAATVVSYAHFQAFKFPDSMSVHFQCVIQVCRYECPEPVCSHQPGQPSVGAAHTSGGAPNDQSPNSPSDYAAAGTELVSSKEPAPAGGVFNGGHAQGAFKIDESQGRVQVKLDTSMMAGAQRPSPLPPHLLHTSNSHVDSARSPAGLGFLSSSSVHRPSHAHRLPSSPSRSGSQVAPAGNRQTPYVLPYRAPTVYAAASDHRMGELAPPPTTNLPATTTTASTSTSTSEPTLYLDDADRPLSMIAAPRSMRMAVPTVLMNESVPLLARKVAPNHRYRRSIGADRDSTAVQTQKTIQVVSPDDMAFSLAAAQAGDDIWTAADSGRAEQRRKQAGAELLLEPSSVCFSVAKLMVALMVTLAAAATSVVAISLMVLRQRSKSDTVKFSTIYDIDSAAAAAVAATASSTHQQQVASQTAEGASRPTYGAAATHHNGIEPNRRLGQVEEMQQRNKYLARFYSQFVPATYWHQQQR